jgi:hypothetical protein
MKREIFQEFFPRLPQITLSLSNDERRKGGMPQITLSLSNDERRKGGMRTLPNNKRRKRGMWRSRRG